MMSFNRLTTCLLIVILMSCNGTEQSVYGSKLGAQLARTDRVDSLLGGLKFGMTRREFFDHCNEAHKRGEMRDGLGLSVSIEIPDRSMPGDAVVEFYPTYNDSGNINSLPGKIYARQWAPWNRELFADSLGQPAMRFLEATLGGTPFEKIEAAPKATYVKLDGNRRVTIYPESQQMLEFEITDLTQFPDSTRDGYDLLDPNPRSVYPFVQPIAHE